MTAAPAGGGLAEVLAVLDNIGHGITPDLDTKDCDHLRAELTSARATAVNYLRSHGDALAELIEAARKVAMGRHTHSAIGAPDSEGCGLCTHNWRSAIHYRVGESAETDLAELRAALSNIEGGK